MCRSYRLFVGAVLACCALGRVTALGEVVIVGEESDGDVIFSGGGTLDTSLWTFQETAPGGFPILQPDVGLVIGAFNHTADLYTPPASFAGPSSIGPGTDGYIANYLGGDNVGLIWGDPHTLSLPVGYVSGDPIVGSTMSFVGHTFASLGLTPGDYTWTWDTASGPTDSFTIQLVPEPSALALLSLAAVLGLRPRASRS